MKNNYFHETEQRGTPEFPLAFYSVDKTHPRYHMRAQWHTDIEIERILAGTLKVQLGDHIIELKKNQSVLMPSGIIHSAEPIECIYECVVFSPSVLNATGYTNAVVKRKLNCPVIFENNPFVHSLFEHMKRKPFDDYEFQVVSDLYAIIGQAIKEQKNNIPIKNVYRLERIKSAINYIEENYKEKFSIRDLSASCSMSPNYFCSFFKEITGQTPTEYITTYRIEAACNMLLSGLSVTDTALSVGFNDLSYFIHVFKKHKGVSPKQYAQSI